MYDLLRQISLHARYLPDFAGRQEMVLRWL
jgi:hypothetical protein